MVTFVAYPHRGEEVPDAAWLGDAMARAAEAAPTLPTEGDEPGTTTAASRCRWAPPTPPPAATS